MTVSRHCYRRRVNEKKLVAGLSRMTQDQRAAVLLLLATIWPRLAPKKQGRKW